MYKCRTRAYEGSEPYIFVSYSHRDSEEVFKIIDYLDDKGFRIWYDEGIAPGSEWTEYIAEHLNACSVCLAFISPEAAESPNCKREINFAVSKKKEFLGVFLRETQLSLGMEMQISSHQCVMKQNYIDEDRFYEKLLSCNELMPCREEKKEAALSFLEKMKEDDSLYMEEREEELREKREAVKDKLVETEYEYSFETETGSTDMSGKNSGNRVSPQYSDIEQKPEVRVVKKAQPKKSTAKSKSGTQKSDTPDKRVKTSEKASNSPSGKKKSITSVAMIACVLCALLAVIIIGFVAASVKRNKKFDVAGNEYRRNTFSINIRDVVISPEDLENIKYLEELSYVSFTNCAFTGIDFTTFPNKEKMSHIEIVDCIGIETFDFSLFPELRTLTATNSGVNMSNIKFHPSAELRDVDLSGNEDITALTVIPMEHVSRLDISNTSVTDLSAVGKSDYLTELKANGLKIKDITPVLELENLNRLYLNDCNLGNINGNIKSLKLTELGYSGNNMTDASAFDDLTVLEYIDVSDNPVSYVDAIKKSTGTLKGVNISHTEYGSDVKELLSKCPNMEKLKLNGLKCIDELSFISSMEKLKVLEVDECSLTSLDGIKNHHQLEAISSRNNSISSLEPLNGIGDRARVDLRNNNIQNLKELSTVSLSTLIINDNPVSIGVLDVGENVDIRKLIMDYTDDLLDEKIKTVIGGGRITNICIVNIPDDKKVSIENIYYSGWLEYATTEQVEKFFASHPVEDYDYWMIKDIGK